MTGVLRSAYAEWAVDLFRSAESSDPFARGWTSTAPLGLQHVRGVRGDGWRMAFPSASNM
jgi:hypothetical protein